MSTVNDCVVCGNPTVQKAKKYFRLKEYYMLPLCESQKCKKILDSDNSNLYLTIHIENQKIKGGIIEEERGIDDSEEEETFIYE